MRAVVNWQIIVAKLLFVIIPTRGYSLFKFIFKFSLVVVKLLFKGLCGVYEAV